MKKSVTLLACIITTVVGALSQEISVKEYQHELSIELFGTGILHSINYHRKAADIGNITLHLKGGLHFNPFRIPDVIDYMSFGGLLGVNGANAWRRNEVLLGVDFAYIYLFNQYDSDLWGCCADLVLLVPRIGYRRYNRVNKIFWSINFTPVLTLDLNETGDEWDNRFFTPYGAIVYGWKF